MTGLEIDVVVPTFNGRELTARCLEHLGQQTVANRVIVVDDASTDGTSDMLRERHPEVTVIELERNAGFSRAVNAGIRASTAELVVLINNDVECRPEFVKRITGPLVEDSSIGMVAGLLLQADGERVDSLGLEVDSTLAAFPRYWGRPAGDKHLDGDGLLGPVGGAAAYRRSALEEAGGFDEAIFGYGEDVDLALRMRAAGWSCAAAPGAVGVHLGSASFGRHSPRQVYHRGWSRAYLLRKYGVAGRPVALARALGSEAGSVAWQLAFTRDASGLRGRIAGWRAAHPELEVPDGVVNRRIGLFETLRRRGSYRA